MPIPWIAQFAISVALSVLAYAIMPKPKLPPPPEIQDGDDPVAELGKPIPVVFGSKRIKELEILWFGDKQTVMMKAESAGGKK